MGGHYDGMSIFGCPKYYRGQAGTREAVRYGYVGAKLASGLAYPPLFVAGVGVLAVCAAVALPIYGGVKLYKRVKHQKKLRRQREARRDRNRPERVRARPRPVVPDLDMVDEEIMPQLTRRAQIRRRSLGDEDDDLFQLQQAIQAQVDRESHVLY